MRAYRWAVVFGIFKTRAVFKTRREAVERLKATAGVASLWSLKITPNGYHHKRRSKWRGL